MSNTRLMSGVLDLCSTVPNINKIGSPNKPLNMEEYRQAIETHDITVFNTPGDKFTPKLVLGGGLCYCILGYNLDKGQLYTLLLLGKS